MRIKHILKEYIHLTLSPLPYGNQGKSVGNIHTRLKDLYNVAALAMKLIFAPKETSD